MFKKIVFIITIAALLLPYKTNIGFSETVYEDTVYEDTVYEDTVYEDTVYKNTVYEDTVYEMTIFEETVFETINYIKNNVHSADIDELNLSLLQDENSFSDNIDSLSYSDVLKEVNWKSVIPKVAVGGAIIAVTGVLSIVGVGALPFVFGIVAKEALIGGTIGSTVVSALNSCIQSVKNGQPIDKRVIKYAIEGAADGFMWGAISGAVVGGIKYADMLKPAIVESKLVKNATRINKQGHLIKTDYKSRLIYVEAKELKLEGGIRKKSYQRKVVEGAKERNPAKYTDRNYDGGHIIAAEFGGSPYIDNIVPMPKDLNRYGKWRDMEREIEQHLKSGKRVTDFKVKINYKGGDKMPDTFNVSYKVNGKLEKKNISNRYYNSYNR